MPRPLASDAEIFKKLEILQRKIRECSAQRASVLDDAVAVGGEIDNKNKEALDAMLAFKEEWDSIKKTISIRDKNEINRRFKEIEPLAFSNIVRNAPVGSNAASLKEHEKLVREDIESEIEINPVPVSIPLRPGPPPPPPPPPPGPPIPPLRPTPSSGRVPRTTLVIEDATELPESHPNYLPFLQHKATLTDVLDLATLHRNLQAEIAKHKVRKPDNSTRENALHNSCCDVYANATVSNLTSDGFSFAIDANTAFTVQAKSSPASPAESGTTASVATKNFSLSFKDRTPSTQAIVAAAGALHDLVGSKPDEKELVIKDYGSDPAAGFTIFCALMCQKLDVRFDTNVTPPLQQKHADFANILQNAQNDSECKELLLRLVKNDTNRAELRNLMDMMPPIKDVNGLKAWLKRNVAEAMPASSMDVPPDSFAMRLSDSSPTAGPIVPVAPPSSPTHSSASSSMPLSVADAAAKAARERAERLETERKERGGPDSHS